MAVQLSPGVNVSEIDLTTIVPAVSTSVGAIAGLFRWGPVGERILINSEDSLVSRFGKPTNYNAETFFSAANFLNYTNALYVSRAANTTGSVVSGTFTANTVGGTVPNNFFYTSNTSGISPGMYVTQSSNTAAVATGNFLTVNSVVNSTLITLSSNAPADSVATTLYFGWPQTSYSSLGLEPGTFVANLVNQIVKNETDYNSKNNQFQSGVTWIAKYPGLIGNSLKISVVDNANSYSSNVALSNNSVTGILSVSPGANVISLSFNADTTGQFASAVVSSINVGDNILVGNNSINQQFVRISNIGIVGTNATHSFVNINLQTPYRLHTAFTSNNIQRYWEYHSFIGVAPGISEWQIANGNTAVSDELHVVVVDEDGLFTGTPGTILESYKGLSRATDAKNQGGTTNYYKEVINQSSAYIWWANDRPNAASNTAMNLTPSTTTAPGNYNLTLGSDGDDESSVSLSTVASAYDLFRSKEQVEISIVIQGRPLASQLLTNYIIDNIVHTRKDCVAVISPEKYLNLNNLGNEAQGIVDWRNSVRNSSYTIMDSGYKYQYDRYNDLYRWVPLNGDVAGLIAKTDQTNDAWWSPAGFNRGQIKNIVKLAYNPTQTDRDLLYVNGVNPVVTFPGQGTVLYGDKTLQSKPSAFDRINVRRLFIVLEKAISEAAKYSLFEFNDSFTRAQFKNLVTPYLRTIQGRRGITDFLVVCDDTNNTPQVINSNQFVGDIYIKPTRSINFIQLNFVAVGTGVQFSQVVGNF